MELFVPVAIIASLYFATMTVLAVRRRSQLGRIELAQLEAQEAADRYRRLPFKEKLRVKLSTYGYQGEIAPILGPVVLLYGVCVLALGMVKMPPNLAGIVGLPVAGFVSWVFLEQVAARRKVKFEYQLLQMFDLLANQIESGVGVERSLEQVLPSLPDPLKTEIFRTLRQSAITKDLVGAFRDLQVRYPSRSMELFIAALEIDRDLGGEIVPALRQAAATLQRTFNLIAEAKAEAAQAKGEFYGLVGIIGMTAAYMFYSSGDAGSDAYGSAIGVIVLSAFAVNFVVGIVRGLRSLRRAGTDD